MGSFRISATAQHSTSTLGIWTFKGHMEVDWQTLPNVFGVTVQPRDGKTLGFTKDEIVTVLIDGNVLKGQTMVK